MVRLLRVRFVIETKWCERCRTNIFYRVKVQKWWRRLIWDNVLILKRDVHHARLKPNSSRSTEGTSGLNADESHTRREPMWSHRRKKTPDVTRPLSYIPGVVMLKVSIHVDQRRREPQSNKGGVRILKICRRELARGYEGCAASGDSWKLPEKGIEIICT